MTHDCPATGCTEQLPTSILMCKAHWARVPRPLQQQVIGAWRQYLGRHIDWDTYMAVRQSAIDAVNAQLAQEVHP